MNYRTTFAQAKALFHQHGGMLRTSEALRLGIHPRTLYTMRDQGVVEQLSRGLYRLTELPPLGHPDLVAVARKIPAGVICLISALALHELTTQIPHVVDIALPRGAGAPRLDYPPIRLCWFTGEAWTAGVETHIHDQVSISVYSPEKTLADCFKYRNKLGLDVALEGLKLYRQRRRMHLDALLRFARICRVDKVMRPYLEAVL